VHLGFLLYEIYLILLYFYLEFINILYKHGTLPAVLTSVYKLFPDKINTHGCTLDADIKLCAV